MNKKVLAIIAIIAIILIVGIILNIVLNSKNNTGKVTSKTTNSNVVNEEKTNTQNKEEIKKEGNNMYSSGIHHASIEVKNYGTIKLELNANVAPITVANFAKLVTQGFYNGLTFHRIMDGFMIQGGDPQGTGFGGSTETIKGEFKANGVNNNISHVRGVISMARSSKYNSASSQFFIVQTDSTFLDGQYAGFGKVTEGIEIVDKICKDIPVQDDNGTVLKANQPVITKITMED